MGSVVGAIALGASVVALLASPAHASVTFESAGGTGFVDEIDVRQAFRWSGITLHKHAAGITFTEVASQAYTATCVWRAGHKTKSRKERGIIATRTTVIRSAPTYHQRVKNQIAGFELAGYGATTSGGATPRVGGVCVGAKGSTGIWREVRASAPTKDLVIRSNGVSVKLRSNG